MTTQDAKKKVALIAVVTFSIAMSMASINLVLGQTEDNAASSGKTVIDTTFTNPVKEDRTVLNSLEDAFGNAETDTERESIKAEAQNLLRGPPSFAADVQRTLQYGNAKEILTDSIVEMPKQDGHNAIPFTQIGYSTRSGMLEVKIHQDFATANNMQQYESIIRSIIGNQIDLKISNGGDYWALGTCSNGPLNDCNPLESGVEMQVTNHGSCTIGMRATYGGDDGFVTAGHCADNERNSNVGQDSISSVIGTVSKETYNSGICSRRA